MPPRLPPRTPLSPDARRLLVERCRTQPITRVAKEMGISRTTASKWVNRYQRYGEIGLLDRSPTPIRQPAATPGWLVRRIESMRRAHSWSAARIAEELAQAGTPVGRRTVSRLINQLGLSARSSSPITAGEKPRRRQPVITTRPGQVVHLIARRRDPDRGSHSDVVFLHAAVDSYSGLGYTEELPDDHTKTVDAFLSRAKARFAAHGIDRIERVVDQSGASYRAGAYSEAVGANGPGTPHADTTQIQPRVTDKGDQWNLSSRSLL